jgi:hypothetical protein
MGVVQDKFTEAKAWYKSKTIIGLAISSISAIVFTLTGGKVDVQGAVNEVFNADSLIDSADSIIASVLFFVGQAVALWGRISAKVAIK